MTDNSIIQPRKRPGDAREGFPLKRVTPLQLLDRYTRIASYYARREMSDYAWPEISYVLEPHERVTVGGVMAIVAYITAHPNFKASEPMREYSSALLRALKHRDGNDQDVLRPDLLVQENAALTRTQVYTALRLSSRVKATCPSVSPSETPTLVLTEKEWRDGTVERSLSPIPLAAANGAVPREAWIGDKRSRSQ